MEYVIVEFDEDRAVYIDDQENGRTNQSLRVGAGTHSFRLGGEQNYSPPEITCAVSGTSVLSPKIIKFAPENTGAGGGDE